MKNLTIETFEKTISSAQGLALVCFSTQWCPPCQVLKETLAKLEQKNLIGVSVFGVDVDDEHELGAKFGVFSIPTLVFMKNSKEVARFVGAQTLETLVSKIMSLL